MQPDQVVQGALVLQGPLVQPDQVLAGQAEPPHQFVQAPDVQSPSDFQPPHGWSPPKGPPRPPQPPAPLPGPQPPGPPQPGPPVLHGPPDVHVVHGLLLVLQTDGSQSPLELVGQALVHDDQSDAQLELALVHEDQSDLVVQSDGAPDHAVVPVPHGPG